MTETPPARIGSALEGFGWLNEILSRLGKLNENIYRVTGMSLEC
ncbi:MAG: hypothetical protein RLZZ387_2370 [Chloroflexota bacterium]